MKDEISGGKVQTHFRLFYNNGQEKRPDIANSGGDQTLLSNLI